MPAGTAQFCEQCGTKLTAETKFCEQCGAAVPASGLTDYTRLRQLFDQAAALPPEQRDAWLANACQGNPALLAQLRGMFPTQPDSFLQQPAVPPPSVQAPAPQQTAYFIGPYRLLKELGRGGMGVVYLAVRDDGAFRKNVAIKLLLPDQANAEFVLRFKQERQVLAALDHPNIARILDGGDTPQGAPYYVMEYVEGVPVDTYCDQQRLSLTGRIQIFQQVCRAVGYLHDNSIVHRDLKPSNILVSADGVVKLLDFGIAKLVGAGSFSNPDLTTVQGTPMTPSYASPEQMNGATLQKASDIYSLGVILYLLVTGRSPYANMAEKSDKLAKREDPTRPSANIREDLRATPESTAQLRKAMMGDLDHIVLMAMRYDPKERYATAGLLADDLQRFLDGQSVTAHRGSVAGRSVKLLKRKRVAVGVMIAFLAVAGFAGWQWQRAESEKAEMAAREGRLRNLLDQLESRLNTTAPGATAESPEQVANRIDDVRQLRHAFDTDFAKAAVSQRQVAPARDALLSRAVRYLDRVQEATPPDAQLRVQVANTYQNLGVLRESIPTASGSNKQAAVQTYRKAAVIFATLAANNEDAQAQQRLTSLNQRIQSLGGTVETASAQAPAETQPAPDPAPPAAAPVVQRAQPQRQSAPPVTPVAAPPAPVQPVVQPPSPNAAALAELDDRLSSVATKVEIADQTVKPIRENLERRGEALNADTMNAINRMHSNLERARREIARGDVDGARQSLDAAEAFATRVLHTLGR